MWSDDGTQFVQIPQQVRSIPSDMCVCMGSDELAVSAWMQKRHLTGDETSAGGTFGTLISERGSSAPDYSPCPEWPIR